MGLFSPTVSKPTPAQPAAAQPAAQPAQPAAAPAAAGRGVFSGSPQVPQGRRPNEAPPANLFAGVPGAEMMSRRPYLTPGRYVAVINDVLTKQNRKGLWRVIVEMTILDVISETVGQGTMTSGSQASQTYCREHDSFDRNVKSLIVGAMRCGADAVITAEDVMMGCGADRDEKGDPIPSPLRGAIVEVTAKLAPTKSGGMFTQTDWAVGPTFADVARLIPDPAARAPFWAPGHFEKLLQAEQSGA